MMIGWYILLTVPLIHIILIAVMFTIIVVVIVVGTIKIVVIIGWMIPFVVLELIADNMGWFSPSLALCYYKQPFFLKNLISDRCKEILTLATPSIAIILTRYFIRFSNSWLYDLLTISFVLAQSWQSWQSLHFLYSFSYVGYKSFFTVSYYTFFHIFVTCFLCMFVTLFSCIFVAIFFCIVVTFSSLNWR